MKSTARKKSAIRLCALSLCLSAIFTLMASPVLAVRDDKTVKVGFCAFDGYHVQDEEGARSGYGYELLQLMARYEDMSFEYVGYDKSWADMQEMLKNGEIDLLTSAIKTEASLADFDFSQRSTGNVSFMLTVKAGNTNIVSGKYDTYQGIVIGQLKGNDFNHKFAKFAEEKGFSYTVVEYETSGEQSEALQSGEVDAVLTISLRIQENQWMVESFGEEPVYAIVRKGDTRTLKMVNSALGQLDQEEPYWREDLWERHCGHYEGDILYLSDQERAYLRRLSNEGRVFKVLVNPDRYPYSYLKDGEITGIMPDIFKEVAQRSGINYEFVPVVDRHEYGSLLAGDEVDICIDMTSNYYSAEQYGYKITDPYITAPFSWVKRKDNSDDIELAAKLVYTWTTPAVYNYDEVYEELDYIVFDTREECLEAVRSGKVDGYCTYTYMAEKVIFDNERGDLAATITLSESQFAIGVSENQDSRLITILNKAVNSLDDGIKEAAIRLHTDLGKQSFSLRRTFYEYPSSFFAAEVLLCAAALLIFYIFMQKRYQKKLKNTIQCQSLKLNESLHGMMGVLATAIEFRSSESGDHVKRIRHLTRDLMTELGEKYPEYLMSKTQIEEISAAAVLHDIGKIGIPDHILNKPGALTDLEFEVIKQHPDRGCQLLGQIPNLREESLYRFAYAICRWHHERWDGKGYPDGLAGDEIPIWAQVVGVADVYDALTSPRVYKTAFGREKALQMIRNGECGSFNPKILDVLEKVSIDYEPDIIESKKGFEEAPAGRDTTALLLTALQKLLDVTEDMVFLKDVDLVYRAASPSFAEMMGKNMVEEIICKKDSELIEDEDLWRHYNHDDMELLSTGKDIVDYLEPLVSKNGQDRYGSTSKYLLTDSYGRIMGILGISRDITSEYYTMRHHQRELDYLFTLPEDAYFAIFIDITVWRISGERLQEVNGQKLDAFENINEFVEWAHSSVSDRRWPAYNFYKDFNAENLWSIYNSGKNELALEYRRKITETDIRWVRDELRFLTDPATGHLCLMLVTEDIQEKKDEEQRIIQMAERDPLTGLLNRASVWTLYAQTLLDKDNADAVHAVLMIDADNFKQVNDTYGHVEGDRFLVRFGKAIRDNFRASDLVGRIGGDEFLVLMKNIPNREVVEEKTKMLLEALAEICDEQKKVQVSGSIGVSISGKDGNTLSELYVAADKAMYQAKREGKNRVVFYSEMTQV